MKIFCFEVSAAEPRTVGPTLLSSLARHHPPRPTLRAGARPFSSIQAMVWTGPLRCDESKRPTASGPGEHFPDTFSLIHSILFSTGGQGQPQALLRVSLQGWERASALGLRLSPALISAS